jgi:2-keto-4-pentenoate hydratase/2-oxohepta-3-ene-1,7-dioic acid hydratase in catechol pathway
MTLYPGDIIFTGTPAGVGDGMDPPQYLRPGDVVRIGVEGLGEQRQVIAPPR